MPGVLHTAVEVAFAFTGAGDRDGATSPASALETFLEFYTSHSPQLAPQEPPRKKRRVGHDDPLKTDISSSDANLDSVSLTRLTLDLHFADEDIFQTSSWTGGNDRQLSVSLQQLERKADDSFILRITSAQERQLLLHCSTEIGSLPTLVESLERLVRLSPEAKSGRAAGAGDIAYARHILCPPTDERRCFRLDAQIRWKVGISSVDSEGKRSAKYQEHLNLLETCFPYREAETFSPWSLQDFYESVHIPKMDQKVSPRIQSDLMDSQLYPFQKRAVDWLLRREGVAFKGNVLLEVGPPEVSSGVIPSFQRTRDAEGSVCYISHVRGMVVKAIPQLPEAQTGLRGGILAEEMGLGKTVELIALICLNFRDVHGTQTLDEYTGAAVTTSKGTLIITPPSILEQWKTEINTHAPHLKVLHYQGIPPSTASKSRQAAASVENLLKYDVVLTTYNVLAREIHYANATPQREFRRGKKYEARRSPLVEISWWRVCLDEAQMVESGVSQAATVARLIPRCNAWAVSGTPLRKDIQDLRGLLIFLRYEPFCSSKKIWDRLDKATFKQIFGQIAMRHTKDKIRQELRLPPQKRMVITVPFTAIEEQNYTELLNQMCDDCHMTADGAPAVDDFDPDAPWVIEKMRTWLVRLRQTCLHPQVGGRNRKALGRGNGPLRTVAEVLEVMIEQNDNLVRGEERSHILARVQRAHIIGNAKIDDYRSQHALEIYLDALAEATRFAQGCREELRIEKEKMRNMAEDFRDQSQELTEDDRTDAEEDGSEKAGRISALQKGLRGALEVQHICTFFAATAYYQIKINETITKPESEEFHRLEKLETEYYDKAKLIRKELLHDSHSKAERRMQKLKSRMDGRLFAQIHDIEELEDYGGIENRKILDKMDRVTEILNRQGQQLKEWRDKVVQILLMPLVDEDEGKETTGDEYEDSTKAQDELYVYIAALRAIVADRNLAVMGQANLLIDHEMKVAKQAAKDGEGHAPKLLLKVMNVRDNLKPTAADGSLRGVITEIRSLVTTLQFQAESGSTRAATELAIVERQMTEIQRISTAETKAIAELEREQEFFRTTMNLRLDFYRQLQQISDTVAPYKEELDEGLDMPALMAQQIKETNAANSLAKAKTKQRFLLNLRNESSNQDESRICVICQSGFEIGVLTVCGHQYCKECIQMWWHEHRTCPVCKRRLNMVDFHQITYKPKELMAQEECHPQSDDSPEQSSSPVPHKSIYSDISSTVMNEIKEIDLNGSYGTKIDTIARHILWIRSHDPGSKSIIFTQFSDFLSVLEDAFKQFKIGYSSIGAKGGIERFRRDPAVEVFLLDAKTDSSGLNLVNATHVFLCEPLINAAIELQAIARVHRIGQQRPTTVYMYLISDTVEESIYEISVARRLAHIGNRNTAPSRSGTATPAPIQESAIDAANSLELQQAPLSRLLVKKKGGGEIVGKDDLWNCLFGKQRQRHGGAHAHALELEVGRHLRAEAAEGRAAVAAV